MPANKRTAKEKQESRRTGVAPALDHLIPGGAQMSDDQLEIALDWLMRRNK